MSFLTLKRYKVGTFALGAAFLAVIVGQKLDRAGVTRSVSPLNNDDCFAVPGAPPLSPAFEPAEKRAHIEVRPDAGLEACEDARWVDQESGLAYL